MTTARTPITERLAIALDDEYLRMENEWFYRWHFIGRNGPVEIDRFDGRPPMRCGGIAFFGTAQILYWEIIQRYLRKKIGSVFDDLEREITRYPVRIRRKALGEIRSIVGQFAKRIHRAAVEKDRILRGDGFEFPSKRDQGKWVGSTQSEIASRLQSLEEIYCDAAAGKGEGKKIPYTARVVKVMIASPSDVASEREIIRAVIHGWNDVHSEHQGIVLMPIGWESHSSPAMGVRPQEIINKQILFGCDLLIAVFWTKFGTPTGKADSGTAEEIDEHLAAGKPALLYFSSEPVVPDSINPDQYRALKAFEQEKMRQGLIERYEDKGSFREKLTRQLAQTVIREFASEEHAEVSKVRRFEFQTALSSQKVRLSDSGRELLLEAVKDKGGIIMRLQTLSSSHVQTNGRDFIDSTDSRTVAKWRSAVDELEAEGLIEDRAGKGEVFFVTNAGFEASDGIAQGG